MKNLLASLRSDLPASIFVFLVALPLCLGIALGSEAPLFSGVIAGMVGGIVVGIISKSSLSVSGPAAGLTTIVAAAIGDLPAYEAFLLAVVLAGLFQILFGLLKLGMLGEYVPVSVIKGMLAAIGLTLILKQIPHLVGDDNDFVGDESFDQPDGQNTFTELVSAIEHITPGAMIIGVCSLIIMLLWETKPMKNMAWTKWLPAPLIVVFGAVAMNELFRLNASPLLIHGVHLVTIPEAEDTREFLSFFTMPDFTFLNHPGVWVSAVTLAIVASLESLLGIEAVDKLDPKKRVTPPNRELFAQGAGNMVSGLVGGLPVTSVVVRSSANVTAGADSKFSTIFHGALLFVSVAFIPGILNLIPLSALAGVLIFVGYKLTKPSIAVDLFRRGASQFVPFAVTVIAILTTDLLIGIGIGLLVGLYFVLKQNFRKAVVMVNEGDRYLIKFRPEVSFLNKPVLKSYLASIPSGSTVYIDTIRCRFIDSDIHEMIEDFSITSHSRSIRLEWRKPVPNE
ncbi:MAG: SulP family inorganic anion transporter [Flavobacteriales bacterium]